MRLVYLLRYYKWTEIWSSVSHGVKRLCLSWFSQPCNLKFFGWPDIFKCMCTLRMNLKVSETKINKYMSYYLVKISWLKLLANFEHETLWLKLINLREIFHLWVKGFSCVVSPEPKTEMKTLRWAISQFASVERIVGEDKYFCENCHHYTEAERSLLFDKMPEVITIHLKCFAASGLEWVC